MADDVTEIIERLKRRMGATSDAELARKLRLDKSTVSSWKARGNVPARIARILEGEDHQTIAAPPLGWGEHENAAFNLALFRFYKLMSRELSDKDEKAHFSEFLGPQWKFWLVFSISQTDIMKELQRRDESDERVDLNDVLLLFLFEETLNPDKMVDRFAQEVKSARY